MFLLLQLAAHAQTKYTVTLKTPSDATLEAYAYGSSTWDRRSEYAAGEEVHLTGSLRSEYSFVSWTDEQGKVVCDSLRYTFTMPSRDITLTGQTEYDPESPPGPREDGYTDTWNRLYLRSNPEYGGAFTWGLGAENAQNWLVWTGYEFTVQAYPATGFYFAGWQLDGEIVSTDNPYTFTMPERDMTLYAMYEYDPDAPAHPHGNKWDKETGELIMSDFTPGKLSQQITEVTRRDPWNSDWNLIKSAIVDGPALQAGDDWATFSDWRAFKDASNVEFLDFSRTSGLTSVPNGCFSSRAKLTSIAIPATVGSIGSTAFHHCTALTSVTCFATTPPEFEGLMPGDEGYREGGSYWNPTWAFDGLTLDNIIVHVPAEAVPLYQEARGWKELMILPITQGVQQLTVNLPQAQTYKDMFLELVNTKTLQSRRYVITGATNYTFVNLIQNTRHTLYLKNQRGDVLGTVADIDIKDQDIQVSFPNLTPPIDVTLHITTPDGSPVGEDAFTATWTDRQGNYLAQGTTLLGQIAGSQVRCQVRLEEALGRQYQAPADTLFSVAQGASMNITLRPIPQRQIGGTVTEASTGSPVRAATVTVNQMLNGLYATSQMVKTDAQGRWTLTAYDAPATFTVTHSDYLKQTSVVEEFTSAPIDFALRDITGTIVDIDMYYRPSIHDGEESVSRDYTGYENVNFTVCDEASGRDFSDVMSVQYPLLVLVDQELPQGTRLTVTATSMHDTFMPSTATCRVDSTGNAIATLPIIQLGQIEASFEMTDNESVVGLLFNEEDQLQTWGNYDGVNLTLTDIPDGRYRLITMGNSMLSTSFNTLHALRNIGLKEGADYVENFVDVSSGHIAEVANKFIPAFDETGFLYTGNQTNFSVNKQNVTMGQYVTLKAQVDFKPAYEAENVQMFFDLPNGCEVVEGSVMVGNHTAPYNVYEQRLSVDVDAPSSGETLPLVRFCVVPTASGVLQVTATVSADLNGRSTRQPIGSAIFSVDDLALNVPATTGRRLLPVTGMAVPLATVEVFDGDVSIGQTTAISTGFWSVMCPLDRPYNLTSHTIHAEITTPEGVTMQSESQTVTINRGNLTPVLTMRLQSNNREHKHIDVNVDFRTMTCDRTFIDMRVIGDSYITFKANFYDSEDLLTNDTTAIDNVVLYTLSESRHIDRYEMHYSERQKCWFLEIEKPNFWDLPVYYDVTYDVLGDVVADRDMMDDMMAELEAIYKENRQQMKEFYAAFDEEGELPHAEEYAELDKLLELETLTPAQRQRFDELLRIIVGDELMDEALQDQVDFSEVEALQAQLDPEHPDVELLNQINQKVFALQDEIIAKADARHADFEAAIQAIMLEESGFKEQKQALRDSMVMLMSYYMPADTTALVKPQGNMNFNIDTGDYSRFYEVRHLDAIDTEQLLADNYTEIPMTDGTSLFVRKDEEGFCFVDSRNSTFYRMKPEGPSSYDNASAIARRHASSGKKIFIFDNKCIGDFISKSKTLWKEYEQMKQAADKGDDWGGFSAFAANTSTHMQNTIEVLKCLYESGYKNSKAFFLQFFSDQGKNAKNLQNLAEKWEKEIMTQIVKNNRTISELEKADGVLQKNLISYGQILSATSDPDIQRGLLKSIEETKNKIIENSAKKVKENELLKLNEGNLKVIQKDLTEAEKAVMNILSQKGELLKLYGQYPAKFKDAMKIGRGLFKITGWVAKFVGTVVGSFLQIVPLALLIHDNALDVAAWLDLEKEVLAYLPCDGDYDNWVKVYEKYKDYARHNIVIDIAQVCNDAASMCLDAVDVPLASFQWWASTLMDIASLIVAVTHPNDSQLWQDSVRKYLSWLRCNQKPKPKPVVPQKDDPIRDAVNDRRRTLEQEYLNGNNKNLDLIVLEYAILNIIRDPAGYVYEAVNSNRVEGVTASCYYKEEVEDMFGDLHENVVLWDAAAYAQQNPLFTDADGRYQWDVPRGLWQVKYEKQGYETTYSDWLPVPPPQLEVNVGITQMRQPQVKKARAFAATEGGSVPSGIEVEFDKYMDPKTLTTENIYIVVGGKALSGKIVLLDAETGYQKPDVEYASKVRFEPTTPLNMSDKVQLTVRRRVESYAGVPMQQDFTQQFDVERRIEQLVADSLLFLADGKEGVIQIKAVPAQASKGKKVMVSNDDATIVGHGMSELTLDQNGEAQLDVQALTPGVNVLRFVLADDEDLSASTLVIVRDSAQMQVAAPRSSRLDGITMYIGSEIRLTCATIGARILYTLDGSCPCDTGNKSIYTYDGPIILTGDSIHIKAMAVAPGMEDSPVVEFTYKGIQRSDGIETPSVPDVSPVGETEPTLFYRLNGQRIARPERGITIERQGSKVKKVVTK